MGMVYCCHCPLPSSDRTTPLPVYPLQRLTLVSDSSHLLLSTPPNPEQRYLPAQRRGSCPFAVVRAEPAPAGTATVSTSVMSSRPPKRDRPPPSSPSTSLTKPVDPSQAFPLTSLIPYLSAHLPNFAQLHSVSPLTLSQFTHGQSNPTFLLTVGPPTSPTRFVLRKQPKGPLLPSAHLIAREYRVLSALAPTPVPVPRVHCLCEDTNVIGEQFYVMQWVEGRVLKEADLPGMRWEERFAIYSAMCEVLGQLHSVDVKAVGLEGFGVAGGYAKRTVSRWSRQYVASKTDEVDSMEALMRWLQSRVAEVEEADVRILHGDYRLDNLIFHRTQNRVVAVLDWELSTLGDPAGDIAYNCMPYFTPANTPRMPGLLGLDLQELGIPSLEEYVAAYVRHSHRHGPVSNFHFWLALSSFRMASICQGVYKRSLQGNAASSHAQLYGEVMRAAADAGWRIAQQSSTALSPTSWLAASNADFARFRARYPFPFTSALPPLYATLLHFMALHVYPNESTYSDQHAALTLQHSSPWHVPPIVEQLKKTAQSLGLWNLFLTPSPLRPASLCSSLSNLDYAVLCEIMGRSLLLAPEACNCSAPDTGNSETIANYGTDEQREQWLIPLLKGEIRSAFAMTEPAVASSDATQIETSMEHDGDSWRINGRKWWTSGALDPRCKLLIVMGKTNPHNPPHRQQSMILVPVPSPGLTIVRPLTVFGYTDAPHGHAELLLHDVRVPYANVLLGEGRGFEIAQGRLGGGRIHHCMRLIGVCERAMEMMLRRVHTRSAFGATLARQGVVMKDIAECRIDIERSRLLVLQAAHLMDEAARAGKGVKEVREAIAMIKVAVPSMATRVIDRVMQAHGALGISQDTPLAMLWAQARTLRYADGPDEVHIAQIAKMQLRKAKL